MLYNALLLTFVELLLRGVTMLFPARARRENRRGWAGALQLVLTVGGFAMTLGLAGLRVTAMYLCAEEYGKGSLSGMQCAIRCCLKTRTVISALAGLGLFFLSDYAAKTWIGDARAAGALRLLAIFCRSAACARFCPAFSQPATGCASWRRLKPSSGWRGLRYGGASAPFTRAGRGEGLLCDGA